MYIGDQIKEMCIYARGAYIQKPNGFTDFSDTATGTECYFKEDKPNRVLTIIHRGTDTANEWPDVNLKFLFSLAKPGQQPYENINPKIKTHPGFMNKYFNVRKHELELGKFYTHRGYKIRIGGHSQGAPIAEYAGLDMQYNFNSNVHVYKYASPGTGNYWYAKSVEGRLLNLYDVVTYGDPIPLLPSRLLGYYNTGIRVPIGDKKFFPLPRYHDPDYYVKCVEWMR